MVEATQSRLERNEVWYSEEETMRSTWLTIGAFVLMALGGCAAPSMVQNSFTPQNGAHWVGSGKVLSGRMLDAPGMPLLNVMKMHLAGMQVHDGGGCPMIELRGRTSFIEQNPLIYVDGVPVSNSCVLQDMPAHDVARVEIYPMGVDPSGSFATSGSGLILVYTRRPQM